MAAITGRTGGTGGRNSGDSELGARMTGEANLIAEQLSGRWGERTYRGKVSFFAVDQVTVPVIANNLVSVFGIYNPPGSNTLLEIIHTDVINVLAATVVDAFGWYSSTVALSALATFTTPGTARSRRMQDAVNSVARVYTAVTHSGTPSLEGYIGGFGAVTNTTSQTAFRDSNGTLMIPPGVLASVAMSKTIGTASGLAIGCVWADVPMPS